jgi:2,4-dichlorophenol 6-monooxygenase
LYCEWQRVREIEEAGALLVRPDGVVAWRDREGASDPKDAETKLSAAICAILDLPSLSALPCEKQPKHRSPRPLHCSPDNEPPRHSHE